MKLFKVIGINLLVLIGLTWLIDHVWFVLSPINKPISERNIRLREHPALVNITLNPDSLKSYAGSDKLFFRTDANGYILPFGGDNSSDSVVFFVGGSTTECYRMPENKRFVYLVGEQLWQEGRAIKTINAGVSGNNSLLSLNIVLNKIAPSKPTAIVLMHAINDLYIYIKHKSYWHVTNKYSNITLGNATDNYWLQRWLPTSFALSKQLKNTSYKSDVPLSINAINDQLKQALLDDFRRNLSLFVLTCQQFNITPILMTQARAFSKTASKKHLNGVIGILQKGDDYFDQYISLFDSLNQATRMVSKDFDIKLIDLDRELTGDTACFYDAIHYNKYGSERVAEIVSSKL
jgi:lysophospholipase L1-like esterase